MDLGNHFQQQVVRQRRHFRPVLDIRTELDLHRGICDAFAVEYTVLIDSFVKEIFLSCIPAGILLRGGQEALVGRRCSDGTGIHESHRRDLAVLDLGTFTVGEVPRRMTDAESIVGRCVSRAETGSAEGSLDYAAAGQDIRKNTVLCQFHIDRRAGRIDR